MAHQCFAAPSPLLPPQRIVIGKQGRVVKRAAAAAKQDLEKRLQRNVQLHLVCRVKASTR